MKSISKKVFITLISMIGLLTACGGRSSSGSYDPDEPITNGKNTDNSFSMVTTWTTSGLVNHYNSNTSCEAFNYFVVEGLYRYVRSTDEIFCQLAAEMPVHETKPMADYKDIMGQDAFDYYSSLGKENVTVTKVTIRDNAKWQNGEDFVAKDVWSYYYMNLVLLYLLLNYYRHLLFFLWLIQAKKFLIFH